MGPKRPKFSRWRRLPGVHRINDLKIPRPEMELQRLTLYLPGEVLDRAEALARQAGAESVQAFCEAFLAEALSAAFDQQQNAQEEARHGALESLDAIANDPDYLAELSASSHRTPAPLAAPPDEPAAPEALPLQMEIEQERSPEELATMAQAEEVVLRHATIVGDDPRALLAALRRGEAFDPDAARELLQALIDLERAYRARTSIDRRLAYALHRLAFEGQVLLTDAWPGVAADPATVDVLRIVQEAVDRVLSGEDIRYYAGGRAGEPTS